MIDKDISMALHSVRFQKGSKMKTKAIMGIISVMALLVSGCITNPTKPVDFESQGQAITSHRVVEELSGEISVVEFYTTQSVPRGKFWAVIPKEIILGESSVAAIHWHGDEDGDRDNFYFRDNPFGLAQRGWRVERGNPVIVPYRPHSAKRQHRRSFKEIATQMALMKYLHQEFGVEEVCLGGHSGGGLVAVALGQELPHALPGLKVRAIRVASTKLAVKNHYRRHEGGLPRDGRAFRQYDPIDHIGKLPSETPVVFVHDFDDKVADYQSGMVPYLNKAEKLGLDVRLIEVNASPPHSTERSLGSELIKSENEKYRCF